MIMKKELKRRIITVIVGAVIMCMVSLVPEMVQAYASTNAVSEDAGIRAEYNGDSGVLTLDVSTNKAMIDFGLEDKKPWTNFNVIKVVVKPGVTHIGNNAFSGCTNLESVVIEGDEPLTIGRRAFYGCTSLKSVEFSKGTLSVGAYAFARCSSLKNVDMSGSQIYELGQFAFGECYSITDLKLSEYTKNLGDYCFQGCNRIKNIDIPDNLSSVGNCAFAGCELLEHLDFSERLIKLGDFCFIGCKNLQYVRLLRRPADADFGTGLFKEGNPTGTYLYTYEAGNNIYTPDSDENVIIKRAYRFDENSMNVSIPAKSYSYTGKPIKPVIKVTDNDGSVVNADAYDVTYSNNKNVGTAVIKITGKNENIGTLTMKFSIVQAACKLSVKKDGKQAAGTYTLLLNSSGTASMTLAATTSGNEKIRYTSSNENVLKVNDRGVITATKTGTAKITICANNKTKSNYKPCSKTITVKVRKPQSIQVKSKKTQYNYKKGVKRSIGASAKGGVRLTYSSSNPKVISVANNGKITIKGVGKAIVTIKAGDNGVYEQKVRKITYYVRPVMSSVSIAHNSKTLKVTVNNPTPNSKVIVKVYESSKMKKLYGKPHIKTVKKGKKVVITVNVSKYSRYYPVIYVKKNGVESQKVTNSRGDIRK